MARSRWLGMLGLVGLASLSSTACSLHHRQEYGGGEAPGRIRRVADRIPAFATPHMPVVMEHHDREDLATEHYVGRELRFASVGDYETSGKVTALYYKSRKPGRRPVVIVLPIWGRTTYPPNRVAADLRRKSRGEMHVLHVQGLEPLLPFDWLEQAQTEADFRADADLLLRRFLAATSDLGRLTEWVSTQPEIDPGRIAVVGFSMGAVVGGLLVTQDPRIDAAVLVMGGARPEEIVASCPRAIGRARAAALERFDWTLDQYRRLFGEIFAAGDAARYGGLVDPSRILFIEGKRDHCMPPASREALWHALGEPERLTFLHGHRVSFLAMTPLGFNVLRREIYRFLAGTFGTVAEDDGEGAVAGGS